MFCWRKSRRPSRKKPSDDSPLRKTVQLHLITYGLRKIELENSEKKLVEEIHDIMFTQKECLNKSLDFLVMFFRLFPVYKSHFKVFRYTPISDIRTVPDGTSHGRKVLAGISDLMKNMNDPITLNEKVVDIVASHRKRHLTTSNLKDMLDAFVQFVDSEMGPSFTMEHQAALERWCLYILHLLEKEEDGIDSEQ